MKTTMNKLLFLGAVVMTAFTMNSCSDDAEKAVPVPVANFTFAIDETDKLKVTFTNTSTDGETYAWDFGDGEASTSTEKNPTYTFSEGGLFTVTLVATNASGSDTADQVVTLEIVVVAPTNLLVNGGLDNESGWILVNQTTGDTGSLVIEDGVATWNGVESSWDNTAHWGMYQKVTLEAGIYQLDATATTGDINEIWFEGWVGLGEPIEGNEYNDDESDLAVKVLTLNTWDCADNINFSGSIAERACQDLDGTFEVEDAGDYYIMIRAGGITWGESGIVADDFTLFKN